MPRASDNYTGPRVSKLRKPELIRQSPRTATKGEKCRGYDRVIMDPWDIDAVAGESGGDGRRRGEKDMYLLPPSVLSEEARAVREGEDPEAYSRQVAIWREEASEYSPEIQAVVLGKPGKADKQPFDPDLRCFLLLKVVEYCEANPEAEDGKGETRAKSEFKRRVWLSVFKHFPDVDPLNREFPEQMAVAAYWDALNAKFSSRVRSVLGVQGKKPIRVNSRLDRYIVGNGKRAIDPVHVWADQADKDAEDLISAAFTEVTNEWRERYPEGKLVHNRLQLTYQARKRVYDRLAAEDENFRARWEGEAARKEPFTDEERSRYNEQLVGTVNYVAARAAELTGTTYVVISVGKFGKGVGNAYFEQHGTPRGQKMVSHDPNSAWAQAIYPFLAKHLRLGYGVGDDDNTTTLRVGHGVPNVHIEEIEEDTTPKFTPPKDFDLRLISTSLKDQKVALHRYFSQHIGKLWGLRAIPWGSDLTKYYRGPPDRLAYSKHGPLFNTNSERVREYMTLSNPLTQMSKDEAEIWFKHIIASEKGEIPEEEALCFIGAGNEVFSIHSARQKGAVEDAGDEELKERPRKRKRPSGEPKPRKGKSGKAKRKDKAGSESESEAESSEDESSEDDAQSLSSEDFEAQLADLESDTDPDDDHLSDGDIITPPTEDGKRRHLERSAKKTAKEALRQQILEKQALKLKQKEKRAKKKAKEEKEKEVKEKEKEHPQKDKEKDGAEDKENREETGQGSQPGGMGRGSARPNKPGLPPKMPAPDGTSSSLPGPLQEGKKFKEALNMQLAPADFNVVPPKTSADVDLPPPPIVTASPFPPANLRIPPASAVPPYRPTAKEDWNVRCRRCIQPLFNLPSGNLPRTFFNYHSTDAKKLLEAFLSDEERLYTTPRCPSAGLDVNFGRLMDFAHSLPVNTAQALSSLLKKVLDVDEALIPAMASFNMDPSAVNALVRNLIPHLLQLTTCFSNYLVFIQYNCSHVVLSAFRIYAFLSSAPTDPVVNDLLHHIGDLMVEGLAVCVVARRSWVHTMRYFSNIPWDSRTFNPIPLFIETWSRLAFHSLRPWHLAFTKSAERLAAGFKPIARRSIEVGPGSAHTLASTLRSPSDVLKQVWSQPWFKPQMVPEHFSVRVGCSYEQLRELEVFLNTLEDVGQAADSSTSIVDAMLHIVLSSLAPLYIADGRLDGLDDLATHRLFSHTVVSMNSRLRVQESPPPSVTQRPVSSYRPQVEHGVGQFAAWGTETVATTAPQPRTPTPGPEMDLDDVSRANAAGSSHPVESPAPARPENRGFGTAGGFGGSPFSDRPYGQQRPSAWGGFGGGPREYFDPRRMVDPWSGDDSADSNFFDGSAMDVDGLNGDPGRPPQDTPIGPQRPADMDVDTATGPKDDLHDEDFERDQLMEDEAENWANVDLDEDSDMVAPKKMDGQQVDVLGPDHSKLFKQMSLADASNPPNSTNAASGDVQNTQIQPQADKPGQERPSELGNSEQEPQQVTANSAPATATPVGMIPAAGPKSVDVPEDTNMQNLGDTTYGEEERPISEAQSDVLPPAPPKEKKPKKTKVPKPSPEPEVFERRTRPEPKRQKPHIAGESGLAAARAKPKEEAGPSEKPARGRGRGRGAPSGSEKASGRGRGRAKK